MKKRGVLPAHGREAEPSLLACQESFPSTNMERQFDWVIDVRTIGMRNEPNEITVEIEMLLRWNKSKSLRILSFS